MIRLFERHTVRTVHELCGLWDFVSEKYPGKHYRMPVPSCWEMHPDFLTYRGRGTYETTVSLPKSTNLRIVFAGVSHTADVDFDGTRVAHHYNAYTPFEAVIKSAACGTHTLSVACDNTFSEESALHIPNDYFTYGGITRTVSVEYLPDVYIENVHFTPSYRDGVWHGHISLRVKNLGSEKKTVAPRITLADAVIDLGCVTVGGGETVTLEDARAYPTVSPWCCETPTLYTLTATIAEGDTVTDDLIDRVGFRTIEVKDGQVQLNGRAIEIRGVCRHEEHPEFGFAFPRALMQRDIDIIKNMSGNAIRGAHYPNSKVFVDMLDEQGILFWSEIPIWGVGFSEEAIANPTVVARGLDMIREMEAQYYNHPSIIIWGMHNEILSGTQAAYEMTRQYHDELRANGGNRLVTHATARPLEDVCYEFDDIICINHYTGWYGGDMKNWEKVIAGHKARRDALGFADKPMIYSEFGGAALYGHHTFDDVKWTEEYQARLFAHCLELFHKTPEIVGWYIWQFTDMRTCREMGNDRARGFNNKGILNEYRKPKMAYHTVREKCRRFAEEEK